MVESNQGMENNMNSDGSANKKPRVMMNESLFELIKRLVGQNVPATEIMQMTGQSKSTVYKAVSKIRENPDSSYSENYGKSGRPTTQHPDLVNKVKNIINEDQSLTQKGIQTKFEEKFGFTLNQTSVCRLLKEAGLTRKRLKRKAAVVNTNNHREKMREYARAFVGYRNREVLFLDETGFNLHTSKNYGYSQIGVSPVTYVPPSKGQNLSACCIISQFSLSYYKLIDGSFNGERFLEFLVGAVNEGVLRRNVVLVMDNAPIHKTIVVKEFLESHQIEVVYLPPYSPDLNPIENFFSMVKSRYSAIRPRAVTREVLKINVGNVLENLNGEDVQFFENLIRKMWDLIYQVITGVE